MTPARVLTRRQDLPHWSAAILATLQHPAFASIGRTFGPGWMRGRRPIHPMASGISRRARWRFSAAIPRMNATPILSAFATAPSDKEAGVLATGLRRCTERHRPA